MSIYVIFCFLLLGMVLPSQSWPRRNATSHVGPVREPYEREDDSIQSLCESIIHTVYPKVMKNYQNVTRFIVNDDHTQGISYETCIGSRCSDLAVFPAGFEGICVQRYVKTRLLAFAENQTGEPLLDTFIIPSACSCVVKKPNIFV